MELSSFTKIKDQKKQNMNEYEFSLITTILLIHHINVRQIKLLELNTESQY